MEKEKYYITTPIYYPSDNLHIGHTYTTVAADTLKRYKTLQGFDAFFVTGTDEHGQKIEDAASKAGVSPKAYVDTIVGDIKDLWKMLDIDYDEFIRTTDENHTKVIQRIFTKLYEKGEIYINSIDFIRDCDNNFERSDNEDGIEYRKYFGEAMVSFCDVGKDMDKEGVSFKAQGTVLNKDHDEKGNIYCLTGIYSEDLMDDRKDIQYETQSFGESLILIHKPKIFIERISNKLKEKEYLNYKCNKVYYYNNDYSGKLDFFKKHEKFKKQKEFRIFIPNEKNEPIKLSIGSLKDIALLNIPFIKITYEDDKEQIIKF